MPDWKALVLERMESLGLSPAQEEEIVSELAAHLEDCYEELRTQGVCESEAIDRSLEQVTDWPNLSREIQRAKRKGGCDEPPNENSVAACADQPGCGYGLSDDLNPDCIAAPNRSWAICHLTYKYRDTDYRFAEYLPVADSLAILWSGGRLSIAPCWRTTPSAPGSRFIALDSSLRFGQFPDAHRPDCALPASMVPLRDNLAISHAATGHRPFLRCLAVLEGNCPTSSG